jgi:2-polyprenyl-6-methoxyphenol hydroxylase-like FAD-dependent oxidoreductase
LSSFDDVKLLDVQLNRLHRWYSDGVLFIGDAAHAMSPVGGVGINLAVADAVAAARLLADPLRAGRVSTRQLARVQMRRWVPTAIIQAVQRTIHANVVAAAVTGKGGDARTLRAVRLVSRTPALRRTIGYMMAIGPLPERTPKFARRPG